MAPDLPPDLMALCWVAGPALIILAAIYAVDAWRRRTNRTDLEEPK